MRGGAGRLRALTTAPLVRGVALSRKGKRLVSCGSDGYVRVFSPETGDTLSELRGHGGPVKSIDWCEMRGGERAYVFASASADGDARIWTVQGARAVR